MNKGRKIQNPPKKDPAVFLPPIYLSLVVEGFLCINKMGGRNCGGGLSVSISTPGNKRHYSTTINKGDQTKFNQ